MHEKTERKKLNNSPFGTGMQIFFNNGYGVSIQFGMGTYSDNHDITSTLGAFAEGKRVMVSSDSAEIGLLGRRSGLHGDPLGYVGTEAIAEIIFRVSICQDDSDMEEIQQEYSK